MSLNNKSDLIHLTMRKTLLKLTFVVLLSGISTFLLATNYYCSPKGTGAGTSYSSPCSLTNGLSLVTDGSPDTLFFLGGTYNVGSKISFNKAGTSTARLAYFAYPGESVIFDFRTQVYGERGFQVNANYLHFKGITIQYAGDNGMHIISSYNIIENCVFHANSDAGLQITGTTGGVGNYIKNCDSYDNFDYKTGGVTAADFGGNADGFADKLFDNTSDTNIYEGCRSWNNSDDGWDMYNRKGITVIKNCWCYGNGPATYDMTNHPRYKTDSASWFYQFPRTVTISGTTTTITVTLASYYNNGNGNGFKIGGNYRNNTVTVENCLSANNKVRGYDQNNNAGKMTLYNCTAYGNSPNYGFGDKSSSSSTVTPAESPVTNAYLTIKNCVSLNSTSSNTFTSSSYLTTSNNSWNTAGVTCTAADFISTDPTVMITSARQSDGSLPKIVFMQLATGSDLINAGTNVLLPFSGAAPDMGCFELGNLDQFPGAVTTPTNVSQTVVQGNAISSIVFTWSAGATGLSVTGLPAGIITTYDNTAKTLTLSGAPTEAGVFNYTVSTVGGTGTPATVSGKIISGSATAKKIAYVTTVPATAPDTPILNKLQANPDFLVTLVDATSTSTSLNGFDLVVLSPVPNSASAGLVAIETLDKPRLELKAFQFQSSRWNWGAAYNFGLSTATIKNKSHEIFKGLTFTGTNNDELQLFSSVSTNGITGITPWTGSPAVVQLGTVTGNELKANTLLTADCITEVPVGTTMNGTLVNSRFLMIGVSESSTANLTATATKLIENSCYYLLGMSIPTSVKGVKASDFQLLQKEQEIEVKTDISIKGLTLFSASGVKVATSGTNTISTASLPKGIYILMIQTNSGLISFKISK